MQAWPPDPGSGAPASGGSGVPASGGGIGHGDAAAGRLLAAACRLLVARDDIMTQRMQLTTGSQSQGSNEAPAHELLAIGSKTKTMTKRKKKTEKKHAADSDVDVQSAKRKAQPRPPDRVPAFGGIARDLVPKPCPKQEAKMRKRSLSPSSDFDSRHDRERGAARARMRSSESAPGGERDRASPSISDYGSDEDDKKEVKLVPASGGDEGDKRDASPLAQVVPASGGHHAMAVSWGQLIGDFWFMDPLVDHFHYHESVRLQQVSKNAWANKAIYRSLLHDKGWRPRD